MRRRVALGLALPLTLVALASRGTAERPDTEPALPTAAVLVSSSPSSDVFLRAYAFEVTATALKELGFHVAPLQLTTSRLTRAGRSAEACLDDDACLQQVAAELGAPTLVLVQATKASDRWRLALRTARVELEVSASGPTEVEGSVDEIFAGVAPVLAAEVPDDPPCVGQLEGPRGLRLLVDGGERDVAAGRVFVAPGARRMELVVPGRSPWRGRLRCEGGRTYALEAR